MTTRSVIEFVAFSVGMVCIFAMFVWTCSGCIGYRPPEVPSTPAYCRDEDLYAAALVRCVDKAKTRAESKSCRVEVDRTCGITSTSAGGRQ